jgi:hypothetical protein
LEHHEATNSSETNLVQIKPVMKLLCQAMKVLQQAIEVFMPRGNSILEMLYLLGIEVVLDRGYHQQ